MSGNWREIVFTEKDQYSFKPEITIVVLGLLISVVAWLITDLQFFGHKSQSLFDVWTLAHVAIGMVISYATIAFRIFKFHHPIMLLLCIMLFWEVIEHYIEISNLGFISLWFGGEESVVNRLITDQIAVVLGFLLIKWRPRLLTAAIVIALGVLCVHVYVGDSMFLFTK